MGIFYSANNLFLIDVNKNIDLIKKILTKDTLNNIKKTYETSNIDFEISNDLIIQYIEDMYTDGGGVIEIEMDNKKYNICIIKLTEEHDMNMEEGYYLSFFENELYELTPKPLLKALNKRKIEPKEENWVSWS